MLFCEAVDIGLMHDLALFVFIKRAKSCNNNNKFFFFLFGLMCPSILSSMNVIFFKGRL
jgi:hypothetical protein